MEHPFYHQFPSTTVCCSMRSILTPLRSLPCWFLLNISFSCRKFCQQCDKQSGPSKFSFIFSVNTTVFQLIAHHSNIFFAHFYFAFLCRSNIYWAFCGLLYFKCSREDSTCWIQCAATFRPSTFWISSAHLFVGTAICMMCRTSRSKTFWLGGHLERSC